MELLLLLRLLLGTRKANECGKGTNKRMKESTFILIQNGFITETGWKIGYGRDGCMWLSEYVFYLRFYYFFRRRHAIIHS